jgi:Multicopper oxidase
MEGKSIKPKEIANQVTVTFQVQSNVDLAPVTQFVIDGNLFDVKHISKSIAADSALQWTLASNMSYFHPFHIHVNPFQVQSSSSAFLPGRLPAGSLKDAVLSTSLEPTKTWRDNVFIPPFGTTVIYQRFGDSASGGVSYAGKIVYHCHFLDHEDQGMIAAMMIADPSFKVPSSASVLSASVLSEQKSAPSAPAPPAPAPQAGSASAPSASAPQASNAALAARRASVLMVVLRIACLMLPANF